MDQAVLAEARLSWPGTSIRRLAKLLPVAPPEAPGELGSPKEADLGTRDALDLG
jgi:hypothetical protein